MPLDDETRKRFEKWGVPPPTSQPHGTPQELKANLEPIRPSKWRMEGNKLIGETEMGVVAQFLPTDLICTGTDSQGLPIFKKIGQ
jgi:hypothetical protein